MRIRHGPWAILLLGIFCSGIPGLNFAQLPNPPVAASAEPSSKIVARLGSAAFDTVESIAMVAWSPDGRFLASLSESGTSLGNVRIDLWNAATGERIWQTDSQVQKVRALQFSSDGRTVFETGVEAASAMDVATGKRVPLQMPTEAVSAELAGQHNQIVVKRTQAGKAGFTIATPREKDVFLSFRFSPDRRFLATGTQSGNLTLWDVEEGRRIQDFELPIGQISSLEFTPNGKLLIAAGSGHDLFVFLTETGKQRFRLGDAWGHNVLAVDPQGKWLASTEKHGGTIFLWSLETGRRMDVISRALGTVNALAFSPDGIRIALAGRAGARSASLGVWHVASGKEIIPLTGHARPVTKLAFSPDGQFVATAAFDGAVCLWRTQSGELVVRLEGDGTQDLRFSPDGWMLGAAGLRGSYRIWEVTSGDVLIERGPVPNRGTSAPSRFSPELDLLASEASPGEVHLVETGMGNSLSALAAFDKHTVGSLAFSNDGRQLAVGSGRARAENALRGAVQIWDVAKREKLHELRSPVPLDGPAYDLSFEDLTFSPDGGTLAARNSRLQIEFWQPTLGVRLHEVTLATRKPMAFSPMDQVLVLAGDPVDGPQGTQGCQIELIETATGGVFQSWNLAHAASAFALSPDGRHLALAQKDSRQVLLLALQSPSPNESPRDRALAEAVEGLAMEDAKVGREAMTVLLAGGERSIRLLASHLTPGDKLQEFDERVKRLIQELHDDDFFVREKATKELSDLGPDAAPALNAALKAKPPLEVDYRIREALKSSTSSAVKPKGPSLKRIRAIEVLERMGTKEAEALLTSLAKTTQSPREASAIRLALERIRKPSPDH